ncbi:Armadillo repeat-containing protein 8 [Cucurbita argyrosperma subsp. argyrosperma]|nr:Armadillo repeat-containing protein 8 [Cucurbita argyrosperma subsp. argyrosperma]
MPTSASSATPKPSSELVARLTAADAAVKLKALRDIKNQIIGNRTKKLSFIKLGVVPHVAAVLSSTSDPNILVQSAAVLGSFSCGVDVGVSAVLDAGAFPRLLRLLSDPDPKVVDAGARSLRMIYQSKLAPKYDFLQQENAKFLLSLLNSQNENVTGLGASIIVHSCETIAEQKALFHGGVLEKLIGLLDGSLSQRDASLESIATIFKNNVEAIEKFMQPGREDSLRYIIELMKDRSPKTRLLACVCLIVIRNSSPCYLQDIGIKMKLIHSLLELLDNPGQVGDEASFIFSTLLAEKEELQKLAFEANAIDKFYNHLQKDQLSPRRLQGILLAFSHLCSKLESCRSRFLSLQVMNVVINALKHESSDIRIAACTCLRSVSRSIKNLSAGYFMNEAVVFPLVQLLHDLSNTVQVAALGAISNIAVDFSTKRSIFIECGGVKELVRLSKSMDLDIRLNALRALRNLIFFANNMCKAGIFVELTASLLASLVCGIVEVCLSILMVDFIFYIINIAAYVYVSDPEPSVQEHAMALVRNLIDGCEDSIEYVFAEDGIILDTIGRQLQSTSRDEIGVQGMYVLCNVASGNELHKEGVMKQLFPQGEEVVQSFVIKFLQSDNSQLRIAAVWAIINLTSPSSTYALGRVTKLRNAGIVSQIKNMANDPCLDVKFRVRTVLGQLIAFGDGITL